MGGGESINSQDRASQLNYYKGNYAKAVSTFAAIEWESKLIGKDVEDMWSTFLHPYQIVVKHCIPLYTVSKEKRKKEVDEHAPFSNHSEKRRGLEETQTT